MNLAHPTHGEPSYLFLKLSHFLQRLASLSELAPPLLSLFPLQTPTPTSVAEFRGFLRAAAAAAGGSGSDWIEGERESRQLTSAAAGDGQGRRLRPQQEAPAAGHGGGGRALVIVRRGGGRGGAARGARGGGGGGGGEEGAAVHRILLDVRARGGAGAARGGGSGRSGGRGGGAAAGPRDAAAGGAGEDAGAGQGPRGPRRRVRGGAGGGRRGAVRVPDEVRRHGRADEGVLRLHGVALGGAEASREARRVLRQHRHAGRRPGDHCLDGHHPASAPRNALCPDRLHLRLRHVQDGRHQRRQPLRCRRLCWRRQQTTQRNGACPRRAPGQVHGLDSEEARSSCLSQPSLCSKSHTDHVRPAFGFPIVFRYVRSCRICAQLCSQIVHCLSK